MRRSFQLLAIGLLLLSGCSGKETPNDTTFRNAIDQHLQAHGQVCAWLGQPFPVDISEGQQSPGIASRITVLEKSGLVQSTDTVAIRPDMLGGSTQRRVRRYEPTAEGRQYLRQVRAGLGQSAGFCYGTKTVESIIERTRPSPIGPAPEIVVVYTYKIPDLASWAKRPDMQSEFGDIRSSIGGISKTHETIGLELTNKGWEVPVQ